MTIVAGRLKLGSKKDLLVSYEINNGLLTHITRAGEHFLVKYRILRLDHGFTTVWLHLQGLTTCLKEEPFLLV
jgi:hypothetical protein